MPLYDARVDRSVSNSSHTQMLELVGEGRSVLDVGCATGYLAEALAAQGCTVSGIEYDAEAAEQARPHLARLVVADLTAVRLADAFDGERFDVVVFGDVLEHLPDAEAVLRGARDVLADGGHVVISIPNVAHGSVRLALLQGRWQYTDTGLLDRTHIRFVTRESLHRLLADAGFVATEVRTTRLDPLDAEVAVDADALPAGVVDWVRRQPDALTYQFVLRAVPDDAPGADVAAARSEAAELAGMLAQAREDADRLQAERDRATGDVAALTSTRTMRALAVPRALYGRLRAVLGRAR